MTNKLPSGVVAYRGPSMLDGKPIVMIITGLDERSRNAKTGALVATWILPDDVKPTDAVNTGADASVCGACPHRGRIVDGKNVDRSCYVTVFQAPLNVWKTYKRGRYPIMSPDDIAPMLAGKMLRIGSYGDPAAVPVLVWQVLLMHVAAKAGYSHQWRDARFAAFKQFCMASCDTPQDFADAKAMGWRTFRMRLPNEPLNAREIVCPASTEGGNKTTCSACRACGGTSAKAKADIAIVAHGVVGKVNAYAAARAA